MREASPSSAAVASLLLAGFVIAMGYGMLLPVLPEVVVRFDPGASQRTILWHMGLVTAVYAGAALVVAPLWGRFSDQSSRRLPIILSLLVSGAASIAGGYADGFGELYFWRFMAGLGAGAAAPSVQVWFSRWESRDGKWRLRRIVWNGLSSTAGLFVGPLAGALVAAAAGAYGLDATGQQRLPFLAGGAAVFAAALAIALFVPQAPHRLLPDAGSGTLLRRIFPWLLPVGATALAISAFEVELSSMASGRQFGMLEVGLLFAECTLVMFAAQSLLILPGIRDRSMVPLIVPALLSLALGLIATGYAFGTVFHILATGLVAAGAGLLPAALAREIAMIDRGAVGASTGLQSAASQMGQTAGAVLAAAIGAFAGPQWALFASALAVLASGFMLFAYDTEHKASQFPETGV